METCISCLHHHLFPTAHWPPSEDTLGKHTLNMTHGCVWLPADFLHNQIQACVISILKKSFLGLNKLLTVSNIQHIVKITPSGMYQVHKSPCKKTHNVVACQHCTAGINRFVCLCIIFCTGSSSMGAAGSYSVRALVFALCSRVCYGTPAALTK